MTDPQDRSADAITLVAEYHARLDARGHMDRDPADHALMDTIVMAAALGSLPGVRVELYDREELLKAAVEAYEVGILEHRYGRTEDER